MIASVVASYLIPRVPGHLPEAGIVGVIIGCLISAQCARNTTERAARNYYLFSLVGLYMVTLLLALDEMDSIYHLHKQGLVFCAIGLVNCIPALVAWTVYAITLSVPVAMIALLVLSAVQAIALGRISEMVDLDKKGLVFVAPAVTLVAFVIRTAMIRLGEAIVVPALAVILAVIALLGAWLIARGGLARANLLQRIFAGALLGAALSGTFGFLLAWVPWAGYHRINWWDPAAVFMETGAWFGLIAGATIGAMIDRRQVT